MKRTALLGLALIVIFLIAGLLLPKWLLFLLALAVFPAVFFL